MDFRIGSTRPMPMNAITQANATAQTARGCFSKAWFLTVVDDVGEDGDCGGQVVGGVSRPRPPASSSRPRAVIETRLARASWGGGARSSQHFSTSPLTNPVIVGWL